ncbi:MAG: hypothetical protein ACRCX7_11365 [Cetobacterium sp.]|uniref:hypothetical protein n=1 Tax=Cetobacterium sp. TaxID=2071632 RepID=UPI003F418B70
MDSGMCEVRVGSKFRALDNHQRFKIKGLECEVVFIRPDNTCRVKIENHSLDFTMTIGKHPDWYDHWNILDEKYWEALDGFWNV